MATMYSLHTMPDKTKTETYMRSASKRSGIGIPWNRVEGVLAVGALLTSFIWFLGMPTGMAIGVGFGIVLLMDFIRALIFGSSIHDQSQLDTQELNRH